MSNSLLPISISVPSFYFLPKDCCCEDLIVVANVGAGTSAFTASIVLPDAQKGDQITVQINLPASANPSIQVLDKDQATVLYSATNITGEPVTLTPDFYYDGTAWKLLGIR